MTKEKGHIYLLPPSPYTSVDARRAVVRGGPVDAELLIRGQAIADREFMQSHGENIVESESPRISRSQIIPEKTENSLIAENLPVKLSPDIHAIIALANNPKFRPSRNVPEKKP